MTEDMENIETTNDDLEKFKQKYEVTWLNEIKITVIFSLGIIALCGALFLALFFTRDIIKDRGTINRYMTIFERSIKEASLEENLKDLTKKPHYAGTQEGEEVGRDIAEKLKKALGDEHVTIYNETYRVLIPHPEGQSTLTYSDNTVTETASLFESPIPVPTPAEIPSYSYWNKSWLAYVKGTATGKLIYVNYGTVDDFKVVEDRGINLQGKIVIARYGKIFRGNIVRTAQLKKCAGVILYSDPKDDGADVGDVYPNGPWRPENALQRGSAMFLGDQPGDPTTPGYPSLPNQRRRITREEAQNLPTIPAAAISAKDAASFMKHLDGDEVADAGWKGGLKGVTYKYGTANNTFSVNMDIKMKEELVDIRNYFAKIEGRTEPDRFVMVGNHRDTWVYGAADPHSGTAVLLELAKAYGTLLSNGWKPRRSLILAFWDGEEQGLIGSTEFVEQYRENLRQQCLAYVNVDTLSGDTFQVVGSASLGEVVRESSTYVANPNGTGSLFESWNSTNTKKTLLPTLVGSGSDYTAFYHHVGIPILDLSFRQKNGKMYGAYHSIHDNFDYFSKHIDPKFKISVALTQLVGRVLFRLVDDVVLDYHIEEQAVSVDEEVKEIKNNAAYKAALDAMTEKEKADVQNALTLLERASSAFVTSGKALHTQYHQLRRLDAQSLSYETKVRSFNDRVAYAERGFVSNDGLPGRPWYKHVLSAPGRDLGYGFEVLPSFKEALRAPQNQQAKLLLDAFSDIADSIESATSFVTGTFTSRNTQTVQ